jgi:hypothetical protein
MVLLFAYLALAATALAQTEGNVTIMVVDSQGIAIPCIVGKTIALRGGADISSHFSGLRGTHIPYGTYDFTLLRSPLGTPGVAIERRIEVKQLDGLYIVVVSRIQFASGAIGDRQLPADYEVRGQIEPFAATESEPTWIRLVPAIGTAPAVDTEVNSSGEFHIYQVLSGRYVALIIRGGKIIDTQEIGFDVSSTGLQRIVLRLSNHTPGLGPKAEDIRK